MTILIVDDEIMALQGILDGVDWSQLRFDKILTANSYTQALNLFLNETVDVLLCDIEMPNGSGLELAEWVQRQKPETVKIFLTCHDEFEYARRAIDLECLAYVLKPATDEVLMEVLQKAMDKRELLLQQSQDQKYARAYIHKIGQACQEKEPKDAVEQAEAYINENLTSSLSVEEIANICYVNPDHLTRLFRKKHGMTVINYIISQRMELAKVLLREGNLSVYTVSAAVGYKDYPYFTRLFKKKFGVTPREYGESHRDR